MIKYSSISLFLLVSTFAVFAQVQHTDYELRYKKAQQLYASKDYEKVNVELGSLTQRKYDNDIVPYAHYLYALSTFKVQKYFEAKTILRSLAERYPNWKKRDEAEYLFTNICFAEEDYEQALQHGAEVLAPNMKSDLESLKGYYFGSITDINKLKNLYEKHPDERQIALSLSDLIQRTSTDPRDLELSDKIANRYGVKRQNVPPANQVKDKDVTSEVKDNQTIKKKERNNKGFVNIGILFPFGVATLDPDKKILPNQYALDMYQGMKLAKNKLLTEGIVINLYSYDVANDTDDMLELINNHSFQQLDLAFGPLYLETHKLASQFFNDNNTIVINPLTTNGALLVDRPLSFLGLPSMNTQASRAADFAAKNFSNKQVAIFYGNGRYDSTLAKIYLQEINNRGFEVIDFQAAMTEPNIDLTGRKAGHIFYASSDRKSGGNFLSWLDKKRIDSPVITTGDAFSPDNQSSATFNGRELFLLDPDFIERGKPEVDAFQKTYLQKYNTIPSVYSFQGYDLMLFWGRMLGKYGINKLSQGLTLKRYNDGGYTLSGFDYRESQDNRVIPLVTYLNYRFVPVNK